MTVNGTSITVDNRTAYEQGGRVKSVCQKVSDNQPSPVAGATDATRFYWEPVARHSYNGIGELTKKTLGCGIQNIDYTYQMRGWLSQMNDPTDLNKGFAPADKHFFGMKLAYDGVGNITTWDYRNAQTSYGPPFDLTQQAPYQYGFTYDNLNRLTSGTLNQQGQAKFTLGNLSYDNNGNLQTLNRALGAATDQLTYSYKSNSNQLASVSDGGSSDFAKSSGYEYDGNGNLIKDSGKGITTPITYNYLNLPKKVVYSGGEVNYTYSASGQKLSASFPATSNSVAKSYDYVGGLVYANNQMEFIPTAEGRVLPPGLASTTVATGSSTNVIATNRFYRYEYHLKDHLGNLRVACRCGERQTETSPGESYEPLVVQEQHYDPFGLDLTGLNSQPGLTADRFKYNGKEGQTGLGWIDYGARMYDPAIGRWNGADALAEVSRRWSPYNSVYSNPLRFVDPDGMEVIESKDKTTYTGSDIEALFNSLTSQSNQNESSQQGNDGNGGDKKNGDDVGKRNGLMDMSDPLNDPLVGLQATSGLYEVLGLGTLYQSFKAGAVGSIRWLISKAGYKPFLRAAYEKEVKGLASVVDEMRASGYSSEEIARAVHGTRREIGIKYKELTPDKLLETIYQRNVEKYGDKLGPTIDYLRQRGKSWDDIIESATRPGGKDINFKK